MFCVLLFYWILIHFPHGQSYSLDKIQLVRQIINSESRPSSVMAFNCWTQSQSMELWRQWDDLTIQLIKNQRDLLQISDPNKIVFFVDLENCQEGDAFLRMVNDSYLGNPYRWIITKSSEFDVSKINPLTDSHIVIATKTTSTPKTYILKQVYKVEPNANIIYEDFGEWDSISGLTDKRTSKVLARRRKNLHGKVIKSSFVLNAAQNDSLDQWVDYHDKHINSISKITYYLINDMLDFFNVTKQFSPVIGWEYQDPVTNKSKGMTYDLINKDIDIGGTSLFMTSERFEFINYLSMTTPAQTRFLFRPPSLSNVENIYYLPFRDSVWLASLVVVIVLSFMVYLSYKLIQSRLFKRDKATISDAAFLSIEAICQMGTNMQPKIMSARISILVLFVTFLFLYVSYTANIVALLQSTTKNIRTLSDLLNSKLEIGIEDAPYNRRLFPSMEDPIRKGLYEKARGAPKENNKFMNMSYGIDRMRKGGFAFHCENAVGYQIIEETFYEHEKCGFMEIDYLQQPSPWTAVPKNSPYREIFKTNLFLVRESGIQRRINSRIYTRRPLCESGGQSFESVRLIDCQAALLIMAYGILLAALVGVGEQIFRRYFRRHKYT